MVSYKNDHIKEDLPNVLTGMRPTMLRISCDKRPGGLIQLLSLFREHYFAKLYLNYN